MWQVVVNRFHARFHRPERGWDPIPTDYAERYDALVTEQFDAKVVDEVAARVGGLTGKRVLDLGGGPGQYTVELAKRGALVTWHDVSQTYRRFVERRATSARVVIEMSFGYFEDAERFADTPFDVVFNRVCWNYSMDDRGFARLVYSLVKPGGTIYVDAANSEFSDARRTRPFTYFLNGVFWLKIGHPHPPRGRIASLLNSFPLRSLLVDYSAPDRDVIFAVRA